MQPVSETSRVVDADVHMRDLAQRHADDVVYAAARFKPNAAGNHELSWGGFGQRQLLKASGSYLAERVVLAITPLDVYAIELCFLGRVQRVVRQWSRAAITVSAVAAHGRAADSGSALRIENRRGRTLAEVQPLRQDAETTRLTELLLRAGRRENAGPGVSIC
jgi:hypothetical protein